MIVYALDTPQSWESVKTKWIPLVIEEGGDAVSIASFVLRNRNPS